MSTLSPVHALPAPEAGDAVAAFDELARSLVDRLEVVLPRAGRSGPHTVSAVDTNHTAAITFPDPFPAGVVPVVQVTAEVPAPTAMLSVQNVTNTGFTLVYRRINGTANVSSMWTATVPT